MMKRQIFAFATALLAVAPAAAQLHPLIKDPLHKPVVPDEIVEILMGAAVHVDDGVACTFEPEQWVCSYAMGPHEPPVGEWNLKNGVITASATERHTNKLTYNFRFVVEAVSSWGVLVGKRGDAGEEAPATLALGPYSSRERNVLYDEGFTTKLQPGNRDRTIYKKLRKSNYVPFPVFSAKPAKNPREVTEIWYQEGYARDAWIAAEWLHDVIGSVEPRKWEWGGFHSLIIIAGARKGTRDTGAVVIVDSACAPDKACESPLSAGVAKAVEAAGWKVLRREGTKKSTRSAVFHSKPMAGLAKKLTDEHLAAVTGSKTLKERKIGGEWYVPADCDVVVYLGSDAKRGK